MNIASTTLGSKILHQYKDHFSKLAVDAVLKLKVTPLDAYHVVHHCYRDQLIWKLFRLLKNLEEA